MSNVWLTFQTIRCTLVMHPKHAVRSHPFCLTSRPRHASAGTLSRLPVLPASSLGFRAHITTRAESPQSACSWTLSLALPRCRQQLELQQQLQKMRARAEEGLQVQASLQECQEQAERLQAEVAQLQEVTAEQEAASTAEQELRARVSWRSHADAASEA